MPGGGSVLGAPRWLCVAVAACCLARWPHGASCKELVCQEISVPMCKGVGYNLTYMPNAFNHDSQDEAGLEVHQFWPLVQIHCSPDLLFFLCSMYTPICLTEYRKPLPPCRSVCERARAGCAPLMRQYGFAWPDRMNCDRLPARSESTNLCMDYNRTEQGGGGGGPGGGSTTTTRRPPPAKPTPQPKGTRATRREHRCDPACSCKPPMVPVASERHPLHNKARVGTVVPNCAMPCRSPYFSAEEMTFASLWIGLWSVACFVASLTTVLTFMIDASRFQYPERPIVLISSCYLFVSLGYIVRLVAGHDAVACSRGPERHVLYETTGPALCTTVFLLTYFFGMASSIWWVILSFTWFLAAGLKWGSEAIASYSQYFHMAAWLLPSVKSIAILAMSSVDGDPVAGICSVGNQSLDTLRGFVLAPMVVYLLIGVVFIMAGFVSLFRIRSVIKQGGKKTDKLDKLMLRIGVVTVLYTLPAAVLVGCYFYEQHHREAWERAHSCDCVPEAQRERPAFAVFMLKYFMCLVAGITSGVWIWSAKTLDSWKRLCSRCCARGRSKRAGGGGGGVAAGGGGGGVPATTTTTNTSTVTAASSGGPAPATRGATPLAPQSQPLMHHHHHHHHQQQLQQQLQQQHLHYPLQMQAGGQQGLMSSAHMHHQHHHHHPQQQHSSATSSATSSVRHALFPDRGGLSGRTAVGHVGMPQPLQVRLAHV